jgi:putative heme-binding domain-containing protein
LRIVQGTNFRASELRWLADVTAGLKPPGLIAWALFLLEQPQLADAQIPALLRQLSQFGNDEELRRAVTAARPRVAKQPPLEQAALAALAEGQRLRRAYPSMKAAWTGWPANFARSILVPRSSATTQERILALQWAELLALADTSGGIASWLNDSQQDLSIREWALRALWRTDAAAARKASLAIIVSGDEPTSLRRLAGEYLLRNWRDEDAAAFVAALQNAPADLQTRLADLLSGHPRGAEVLLQAMESGKASPRLLQNLVIRQRLEAFDKPQWRQRIEQLARQLPPASDAVAALIRQRLKSFDPNRADPNRGRIVFQKHCANCHRIGNEGTNIGPKLDGIGSRGLERLAEDILDPNRNVDEAYRLTLLLTRDGRSLSGLKLRQEGQQLIFADQQGKEFAVAQADIEKMQTSPLSLMPGNFGETIPVADFSDLLAYLLSLRGESASPPK